MEVRGLRFPFRSKHKRRHFAVFVLALLVFAGCGKGGCNVSSSSSRSWNVNDRKTSHKTITESRDGVTRRVETTADVEFANGQVFEDAVFAGPAISLVGVEVTRLKLKEGAQKPKGS